MPTFSVPAGTYTGAQTVAISDAMNGAQIYYTTDGSTPTPRSTFYVGSITVSSTETLKAIAWDFNYLTSPVASATFTINSPPALPDFSVSASPVSFSLNSGQSGTTAISVAPLNGFNSTVSFACSGLPSGALCSFSPATVTPSGAAASTTLTITTSKTTAASRHNSSSLLSGSMLAIVLCFFGSKKKWRAQMMLLLLVFPLVCVTLSGCGSKSGPSTSGSTGSGSSGSGSAPQPVTSTVTITATAGSLQHTTTLSLTVN